MTPPKKIVLPNKTNTVILASIFRKGAIHENEGKEGIAHLAEHCLFREVKEKIGLWNIVGNAFTNYYTTTYAAETMPWAKKQTERFIQKVMTTKSVSEKTCLSEISVVRSELSSLLNNPIRYISRLLIPQTAFRGRRAKPVLGTLQSISKINIEDINRWIREHPEPIVIEYTKHAQENSDAKNGKVKTRISSSVEYTRKNVTEERPVKGHYGAIVWTAPLSPTIKALLNYVGNTESETWKRLRRLGTYFPRFGYTAEPLPRVLVYFETDAPLPSEEKVDEAFSIVLEAIEKIRDGEIDEKLLTHARTLSAIKLEHHTPSIKTLPQDVAHLLAIGQTYAEFTEKSISATSEQIMAAAQAMDKPRFVKVLPKSEDTKLSGDKHGSHTKGRCSFCRRGNRDLCNPRQGKRREKRRDNSGENYHTTGLSKGC